MGLPLLVLEAGAVGAVIVGAIAAGAIRPVCVGARGVLRKCWSCRLLAVGV